LPMVANPMFFILLETAFPWGSKRAGNGMMSMAARNVMLRELLCVTLDVIASKRVQK